MKVRIEIDTKTFVRFWLVVIGFVLAMLLIYKASTALLIIGVSFFLAVALSPPVNKIAGWLPGKSRTGGTALAYVAVLVILIGFIFLVIPPIVEQSARFAQTVPQLFNDSSRSWGGFNSLVDEYGLRASVENALESIRNNATSYAGNIGTTIITGAGSIISVVAGSLIAIVLTFLMLVEGPAWLSRIWGVYQNQERMEHHRSLLDKMYRVVTGYVNGQLTVAFIAATTSGIAVFLLSLIFNLPSNLSIPIAVVVFVGAMIPMFGATIGGIIAAILLAFNNVTAAVIFIIFFFVYQQLENNIISPMIQSKNLKLSALVVLVSVTIGTFMFGIPGGIISIPVAGSLQVIIVDYLEHSKRKRVQSQKPLKRLSNLIRGEDKV